MVVPRPIKFLISGGSAAIVEYILFLVLLGLMEQYILVIQAVSFLAGFVVSFTLNKTWVFSSKNSGRTYHELWKYAVLATANLVISGLFIWLLVDVYDQSAYISKLVVMVVIAAWNYFIFQKIIFK